MPARGCSWAKARSASSAPRSTSVSGFRSRRYSPRAARAATLLPSAKPRFSGLAISRARGNSAATASAEPSARRCRARSVRGGPGLRDDRAQAVERHRPGVVADHQDRELRAVVATRLPCPVSRACRPRSPPGPLGEGAVVGREELRRGMRPGEPAFDARPADLTHFARRAGSSRSWAMFSAKSTGRYHGRRAPPRRPRRGLRSGRTAPLASSASCIRRPCSWSRCRSLRSSRPG